MKKDNKGFSLVELIIVIAIMAVLIGILAPQYLKYVKSSKISTDITNAEQIATAINVAIADGQYALPAAGATSTITNANIATAGIENLTAFPDSKLTPGTAAWVVTIDDKGIATITLNTTAIWPDATAYEGL